MQQIEMSPEFQAVVQQSERKKNFVNNVLAVLMIMMLIWAGIAEWRKAQQEKIESIKLIEGSVKVLGPTSLCPGDRMVVRYSLDIDGIGVIITDDTVQHGTQTVKFSEAMRDYVPNSSRRAYELPWDVPERPEMSANGNTEWLPGLYVRYITVAASNAYVSRYTDPASFSVQLYIKDQEECPK